MAFSLSSLLFSLLFGIDSALACSISACELPDELHLESPRYDTIPADDWSWMNHDLALARVALSDGDVARAETIGLWLEHAIDLRLDAMNDGRGKRRVKALRHAVDSLTGLKPGGLNPGGGGGSGPIAGFKGSSSEIGLTRPIGFGRSGGLAARSRGASE